jgi:hypothetical protein
MISPRCKRTKILRSVDNMSMNVQLTYDLGLLRATTTGHFSIKEAERTFLEIIDAILKHNARKVLFDGLKITGKPDVMERFYYGEFVAKEVMNCVVGRKISHAPKFAYLLRPPVLDANRFGETVAANRGMIVKTFETLEDAS